MRVFMDSEDLASSPEAQAAIDDHLRRSRFLLVICSRETPGSDWVDHEVQFFLRLGRKENILTLLGRGRSRLRTGRMSVGAPRQGSAGGRRPWRQDVVPLERSAPCTAEPPRAPPGSALPDQPVGQGARSTVLKSRDGGATFTNAGSGIETYFVQGLALDPQRPAVLYAAVYGFGTSELYKTQDAGGSWQPASADLEGLYATSVAIAPRATQTLFVGVEDYNRGGVWKSTDGGATWTRKTAGLPPSSFGEGTVQMVVDPEVAGRVFATYTSLNSHAPKNFRSTDGGETWSELSGAGDWARPLASGEFRLQSRASAASPLFFAVLDPDPKTPRVLYTGFGAGLSKSVDGGNTFEALRLPPPSGPYFVYSDLAVDPTSLETIYAGGYPVYDRFDTDCDTFKSRDGGATWTCMSLDRLSRIYVHPARPASVYTLSGGILYQSADRGASWHASRPRLADSDGGFLSLAFDPRRPQVLYAGAGVGTSPVIWRSADGGVSWILWSRGFSLPVSEIIVDPRAPSTLYAAVDRLYVYPFPQDKAGVYRSIDGGRTWSRIPGLPEGLFNGLLAFDPIRGTLYAGTIEQGAFAATMPR